MKFCMQFMPRIEHPRRKRKRRRRNDNDDNGDDGGDGGSCVFPYYYDDVCFDDDEVECRKRQVRKIKYC